MRMLRPFIVGTILFLCVTAFIGWGSPIVILAQIDAFDRAMTLFFWSMLVIGVAWLRDEGIL